MKLVVAWLFLMLAAIAVAGSCSIHHASGQYECTTNADCADLGDGRVCSEGLCVVPGGSNRDAAIDSARGDGPPGDSAALCPAQCTSCNLGKKECTIDCSQNPTNPSCGAQVICPIGFSCLVKCNVANGCRMGVNCSAATACDIQCTSNLTCRSVTCGAGPCNVNCSGMNSCNSGTAGTPGVQCGGSCACDVKCQNQSCFPGAICPALQCDTGQGCSSEPVGCNTCP